MAEAEKLNIYLKLAKMRVDLQKKNLQMSGFNKYSNFHYYELSDFLPYCNEIAEKYKVLCLYKMEEKQAVLKILNTENLDEFISFELPLSEISIKGAVGIQNTGGLATYTRRYLYLIAWEISEIDELDQADMDSKEKQKEKDRAESEAYKKEQQKIAMEPISEAKIITIEKELSRIGLPEASFCERFKIDGIEDLVNAKYPIAMDALRKTPSLDMEGFE